MPITAPENHPGEGWIWAPRIDPNCGEYGVFVRQDPHIRISHGESAAVITGMRVVLNNHFASMPVCGHGYASAQFIGRGPAEFSMQLAGIGDDKLSHIQAMYEELEENSRLFRRFAGAGRVRLFGNEFLRLAGIDDGIITSIDTETDPDGTNLYRCQVSFTSDGHHTEGFQQEMYVDSGVAQTVLETLLQKVAVLVIDPERNRRIRASIETAERFAPSVERALSETLDISFGEAATEFSSFSGTSTIGRIAGEAAGAVAGTWFLSFLRNRLREAGYDRTTNLTSVDGMLHILRTESDLVTRIAETWQREGREGVIREAGRGAFIRFPIATPVPQDQNTSATYAPSSTRHAWVDRYVQQVCDILHEWQEKLPPAVFFRGDDRGRYINYTNPPQTGVITSWPPMLADESSVLCGMVHGQKTRWPALRASSVTGRNALESNLLFFEDALMSVAQLVLDEAHGNPDFDEVFPGVTQRYIDSPRDTAHPTYPDLGLPRHPVSNRVIDTEPDFYFYNDAEENLLNDIGPDITNEIDYRLTNMESWYRQLSSGQTWRETYLGRSRVAVPLGESNFSYDEGTQASLDDRFRQTLLLDGLPGATIDNTTTEGESNWGHDTSSGRELGGGTESRVESIVDLVMGMSPSISSSTASNADVLRERRAAMMRATTYAIPTGGPENRETGIQIGPVDSAIGQEDRTHSFNRNAIRSIVEQSIAQSPETTLTMRRAFPTFKIYFIEDDTGAMRDRLIPSGGAATAVRPIMYFDDLYNYNSVKSIRLVRSRKSPADLLVLQLTNVQGLLERRRWLSPRERERELYLPGFEDTEMENPLKKLIMKEGLKVQARLGYTNDVNKMGIKFIGEVVEFSFNAEASDEVTIICQSYGTELALEGKGISEETRSHFIDTPDLVHTLMCSPELVHFGRFELNPQFNPAEARTAATSRGDISTGREPTGRFFEDPRNKIARLQEVLAINRSKWILANNPADDNIFAPGIRDHLSDWERFTSDVGSTATWSGSWITAYGNAQTGISTGPLSITGQEGLLGALLAGGLPSYVGGSVIGWLGSGLQSVGEWLNDGGFTLFGQTIWEVLKECELRHPGWIAHPRPYGTRMTLFFGVPSHRYWADQISREEMVILQRLRSEAEDVWRADAARAYEAAVRSGRRANSELEVVNIGGMFTPLRHAGQGLRGIFQRTCFELATNRWMQDRGEFIASTLGRFKPFRRYHLLTSDHHILMNNIRASDKGTFNGVSLQYGGGDVYTLKADDSIPDEKTKFASFSYPSCDNETLARRYCIGLLNRHLKDVYKGEIIVTGMDVDPYDLAYLHDDRTGMYGAFEIEQVVDTFTPETGWITEITPDLITGTNEWSTQSTSQARIALLGALSSRLMNHRMTSTEIRGATATGVAAGTAGGAGVGAVTAVLGGGGVAHTAIAGGLVGGGIVAAGAAMAWLGGYHIVRWTQDRQPIWVCPLILGERPFFAGLDGFRQDGIFANIRGQMHAQFDAVSEGWRTYHLSGYANDFTVSIAQSLAGQGGA